MIERTVSIMLLTMMVVVTLHPAWTAELNDNSDVNTASSTTVADGATGGYPVYVPYLSPSYGMDKRAQMGFQGMRGKKDNSLSYLLTNPKRASSGFHGMRGKKYYDQDVEDTDQDLEMDKRMAQGFHGMRGKKDDYDLIPLLDSNYLIWDENDVMKRAMSGFHGMRGKKDDELNKRAQQGFVGMRGKKSDFDDVVKRAMGFHGMRGKKLNELGFKRAQQGFLGMRGKKMGDHLPATPRDNELIPGDENELNDLLAYLSDSSSSQMRVRRSTPGSKTGENGLLSEAE